jgi:hypothetical protein
MILPPGTIFLSPKGTKTSLGLFEIIGYDFDEHKYVCFALQLDKEQKLYTRTVPPVNFLRKKLRKNDQAYLTLIFKRCGLVKKEPHRAQKIVQLKQENVKY